ncbi:hypothetical protein BGX23_000838 [Mortierella sp. AD031]|nr:hypothetical protein BGX23_000838 [Mortierella sp. AD031]
MQALTPILFSMLFPRFSNKSTTDGNDAEGHYSIESLLSGNRNSTSSELLSFGEGYHPVDERQQQQQDYRSAKARRHHSTGSNALIDSAHNPRNNSIRRNNTVPPVRRASRPTRLSTDHAAFMATYPSLDGLGDMGRTSSMDYYHSSNNNSAYTANSSHSPNNSNSTSPRTPRKASSSSKLRKQQSQEQMTTMPASIVSDSSSTASTSSSTSSSASSVREPLTPTKTSNHYHSILNGDTPADNSNIATSSRSSSSKRVSFPNPVRGNLINVESNSNSTEGDSDNKNMLCYSPQSDNFFAEEGFAGPVAVRAARGQRQLIAH